MAYSDFVLVNISLANATTPTVQGLNTGLVAAFHSHFADRVRVYPTASALTLMAADGFSPNEPAYKAVSAYASCGNAPANVAVGRRALPPLQVLKFTCTDGTVGDRYDLTLVGSDGKSHALTYSNVIAVGSAVTGTVADTNGSTAITFSGSQSMAKGDLLIFASQPGVYYALAAAIVSSTAGTLTGNFQGTTTAADTATHVPALAGTFDAVNGSPLVATTTDQTTAVNPGDSVQFVSQLGTYYTVLSVTSSQLTLTTPYSGVTGATTNASVVCQVTTAASALQTAMALLTGIGTATVSGAVITLTRVDGALTDVKDWLANGFHNLQLADTTADPGIATDLNAIRAANNGAWYGLMLDSNSKAEVEAAAAWAEATGVGGKFLFWNTSDYADTDGTVTTDVFSQTKADTYKRNFGQQNNSQLLCYAGASICGNLLARNPGSYTAAYKGQPGVPADSDTTLTEGQALAINSMTASSPGSGTKNGNYYKAQGNLNFLWPGVSPSGDFIDTTIGIDWLQTHMQADVLAVIAGQPKLPYSNVGLGLIKQAIDARLRLASTPAYGLVLPDGQDPTRPIAVTVQPVADIATADRAERNVPSSALFWSAGLQGAIQTAGIAGQLVP